MASSAHATVECGLPKRIGRYEAFLQIGTGGMARVYLAVHHGPFDIKKLVVIKQMREDIARDPQYLEMFIDEARIAARLNHPNIVQTYEVLDEGPEYCLVMEFMEGQSLLQVLDRAGRFNVPLDDHIWILTQVLAGLHYAHELHEFDGTPLSIVHRDVTPSNVFVCRDGAVKLIDFGIAKISGALAATNSGVVKGKIGYVAPEQCLGHPASVQSDVYAAGVMLWEAMARRRRALGQTLAAQVRARVKGLEPPIERVWPDAPQALVEIVERALCVDPDRRYRSARQLQQALQGYLRETRSEAGPESVARLIAMNFAREQATTTRSIAAYLGEDPLSEQSQVGPCLRAAPLCAVDSDEETPREGQPAEETPLDPIDEALLEASRRAPLRPCALTRCAARMRSARAASARKLRSLFGKLGRREVLLGTASLLVAAAFAVWILPASDDRPDAGTTAKPRPAPQRAEPVEPIVERVAPPSGPAEPDAEFEVVACPEEEIAEEAEVEERSPPDPRPLEQGAQSPKRQTGSPPTKPGINLRRVAKERRARRIDETNPYTL